MKACNLTDSDQYNFINNTQIEFSNDWQAPTTKTFINLLSPNFKEMQKKWNFKESHIFRKQSTSRWPVPVSDQNRTRSGCQFFIAGRDLVVVEDDAAVFPTNDSKLEQVDQKETFAASKEKIGNDDLQFSDLKLQNIFQFLCFEF